MNPSGPNFVGAKESIALGTESEIPWLVVDQGTAMFARHDGFVFVSGISETDVDSLAAWVVVMSDAAVETVVLRWVPGGIVEAERVVSGCR